MYKSSLLSPWFSQELHLQQNGESGAKCLFALPITFNFPYLLCSQELLEKMGSAFLMHCPNLHEKITLKNFLKKSFRKIPLEMECCMTPSVTSAPQCCGPVEACAPLRGIFSWKLAQK